MTEHTPCSLNLVIIFRSALKINNNNNNNNSNNSNTSNNNNNNTLFNKIYINYTCMYNMFDILTSTDLLTLHVSLG